MAFAFPELKSGLHERKFADDHFSGSLRLKAKGLFNFAL